MKTISSSQKFCECDNFDCELTINMGDEPYRRLLNNNQHIRSKSCTTDWSKYKTVEEHEQYFVMELKVDEE